MQGIIIAYVITFAISLIFIIIALGWRIELIEYRRKEHSEKDTLQSRLIRNSNAFYKK